MSSLSIINMTADTAPPGLEKVSADPSFDLPLFEQVAIRQAHSISADISYIFFRRFSDGRSSQITAYVVDNEDNHLNEETLATLHRNLWLSAVTPLLYVSWRDHIDILSCAAHPVAEKRTDWKYSPEDTINTAGAIDTALASTKARQYSSYRLIDGTFWEDERNHRLVNHDKSAHKVLIEKVKKADEQLGGDKNSLVRRLLLLTLLVKYLEDRSVFQKHWFSNYHKGAKSFLDVLENAPVERVLSMFKYLEKKFNGDIFSLPDGGAGLSTEILQKLASVVDAKADRDGQRYFWDIYSLEFIPIEVLSHIYQHFTDRDKGAHFTPLLLVDFLLDQVMPLNGTLEGSETVFDPTCGSGVFLVAAFKRLVYVWRQKNAWQRPTPAILKSILKSTIFGVELQEKAVDLTAFSLSLAICDALLPDIIWKDLRFDQLKGANLFVGDFAEKAQEALSASGKKEGFDIIVGNPPFMSKLTPAMKKLLDVKIPDNQMAYSVLKIATDRYLKPNGLLCLILPAGFLYYKPTAKLRNLLLSQHTVRNVFDFVSVRSLFKGADADTKIIAMLIEKKQPEEKHHIQHWIFRRTQAIHRRICLEIDYYDFNFVPQNIVGESPWIWRSNLLGGGRIHHLAKRLGAMPTLADYCSKKKWSIGEGFFVGSKNQKYAPFLDGMNLLPTDAWTLEGINELCLPTLQTAYYQRPRTKERYRSPMVLIQKNLELPSIFWNSGDLAYRNEVIGINASGTQFRELEKFEQQFKIDRLKLKASLVLFSTRMFTSKATAVSTTDVYSLPWPLDNHWDLCKWEETLIDDLNEYIADFIRNGQESILLTKQADERDIEGYCQTVIDSMKSTFPDIHACASISNNGLRLQAFCLEPKSTGQTLNSNIDLDKIRQSIFKKSSTSFQTLRIVRMYDNDTIIFIKPDRLRYWIKSVALRDVDCIIGDLARMAEYGNE